MLKLFYTIGQAATLLGVSVVTMRRWTTSQKIHCTRTLGGHRRFKHDDLFPKENDGLTLLYARVSSRDQVEDLAREMEGKVQKNVGDAKEAVADAADDAADAVRKATR